MGKQELGNGGKFVDTSKVLKWNGGETQHESKEEIEFGINISTDPTNVAESYEDGTLTDRRAGTVAALSLDGAVHIFKRKNKWSKTF